MKQVEKAIGLMLGVVNTIDMNRSRQVKIIRDLEAKILADRNRLSEIDVRLAKIATNIFRRYQVLPNCPLRLPNG